VTNVTGPLPCTAGATWNFTAGTTPTEDNHVSCSIPGNPVATQKIVYQGGNLQQCAVTEKNVTFISFPTGNQCFHLVQLAPTAAPGGWAPGCSTSSIGC
jgi:hypothetical protein